MNSEIKSVPFSWNDNLSEVATEDFQLIQKDLPYGVCQSIGMALAKLELLEKQGCKVDYENLGKSDAEEFEKDFSEIIELADKALEQQPCEDTISRQAAIDALARMMPRSYTPDRSHPADEEIYKIQEIYVDCIESIEILPAVQPEIIRCKDCKHWDGVDTCDVIDAPVWDNDFCSMAERRTDE